MVCIETWWLLSVEVCRYCLSKIIYFPEIYFQEIVTVLHSRMQQESEIWAKRWKTAQLSLQPLAGRGKSARRRIQWVNSKCGCYCYLQLVGRVQLYQLFLLRQRWTIPQDSKGSHWTKSVLILSQSSAGKCSWAMWTLWRISFASGVFLLFANACTSL